MKYVLFSYLILAIVMIYFANKMLEVSDNLEKKVLGIYSRQYEEINKATGMDVYNVQDSNSMSDYQETLRQLEELQ